MNKIELKNWVEKNPNLVSMKESVSHPGLFVLKYKKRVFYDNLWNRFLEECRGTVIDKDFNVVSRPFTKIYNYGIEKKSPKLDPNTVVTAHRKVNGFMAAMTWHNGEILVSTTGSLDSDFVKMASEYITDSFAEILEITPDHTFMFECVHPNDPHIIPEKEGLYLLGFRAKSFEYNRIFMDKFTLWPLADRLGCHRVEIFDTTVGDLQEMIKAVTHEGFVFYTKDGQAAKIKSPYYLIKKFVARNPNTAKLMRPDIKNSIDEEYYNLIDHIQANIVSYTELDEQARLQFVREFLSKELEHGTA